MGILSELDNLLEKIPLWKKLKFVPSEIEDLKRRVVELEKIINSKPGDKCPKCGDITYLLDRTEPDPTFGRLGLKRNFYKCSSCGYETFEQK